MNFIVKICEFILNFEQNLLTYKILSKNNVWNKIWEKISKIKKLKFKNYSQR